VWTELTSSEIEVTVVVINFIIYLETDLSWLDWICDFGEVVYCQ